MSIDIVLKYTVLLFMLLAIIACSLCIIHLMFGEDLFATSSWIYNPKIAIECRSCGCIYSPSFDGKRNLAPRYCPYCGKRMNNWRNIII